MNIKEINLSEQCGENLYVRVQGLKIFQEIKILLDKEPSLSIIFDLLQINNISTGFAKDLFGELYKYLGKENFNKKIKIKLDPKNDVLKKIIIKSIYTSDNSNKK